MARQRRIRRWIYATAAACLLTAIVLVPIRTGYFNRAGMDIHAGTTGAQDRTAGVPDRTAGVPDRTTHFPAAAMLPLREYNIVVGSFRDFGNARSLRNRLEQEGYTARILSSDQGFFRVSAGTYSLQDEAVGNLATIRQEFETAWILSN
jgi:cell division protein FtsN